VLLAVVDRMKEARAAPVLAAMHPDKAREVTAELAQLRTRRNDPGAAGGRKLKEPSMPIDKSMNVLRKL
jgi:flagellar motility protein MotE (MotC chaperone)